MRSTTSGGLAPKEGLAISGCWLRHGILEDGKLEHDLHAWAGNVVFGADGRAVGISNSTADGKAEARSLWLRGYESIKDLGQQVPWNARPSIRDFDDK